jgi:hypothetical protein
VQDVWQRFCLWFGAVAAESGGDQGATAVGLEMPTTQPLNLHEPAMRIDGMHSQEPTSSDPQTGPDFAHQRPNARDREAEASTPTTSYRSTR